MTEHVRRLSQAGIEAFHAWLAGGGTGQPPRDLLEDPATSEALPVPTAILAERFDDRFEFGSYLVRLLRPCDPTTIRFDSGLWDWLSLHFIDLICPEAPGRGRKVGEIVRYSLEIRNRKWSRHLVRMSWMLVQDHGDAARFMLSGPLHVHGDVVEQLAGRQELLGSRSFIEAASLLYWDEARGRYQPGMNNRSPTKGGTLRRLVTVSNQFARTYDLDSMRPDRILALLPREFDRWRPTPEGPTAPVRPSRSSQRLVDRLFDRFARP